jgi:hypothetical protein
MVRSTIDRHLRQAEPCEERVEHAPVGVVHLHAAQAEPEEALAHQQQDLEVGRCRLRADGVEIDLDELAVAAALGVLAAPDLGRVPALEGERKLAEMCGHEPGEGHGEVVAHGHVPAAVVGEPVDLLVGLAAALTEQHLRVLQHRRVNGREAVAVEHHLQLPNQGEAHGLPVGQEIPEPLQHLRLDKAHGVRSFS